MFFPYKYNKLARPLLRVVGVREGRDGVRVDAGRLVASFGLLKAVVELDNIRSARSGGPYSFLKVIGPRLSLADHGLTFGTNAERGVCLEFQRPIRAVIGPWDHPGLTLTIADPQGFLDCIGNTR